MAVPKKKKSKRQSRIKYSLYMYEERRRLKDWVNLVSCKNCGALKKNHTLCSECWFYNWKQVIEKKRKKATVVHV